MSDIEITMAARNDASKVLRDFRAQVEQDTRAVELSFRGMVQGLGIGVMVSGIEKLAEAAGGFAARSVEAFSRSRDAAQELKEALEIFAGDGGAAAGLQRFANDLEKATAIDSSKIMGVMSSASRSGAGSGEIDDMAKAAIGLSRALDTDLATAMGKVQAAMDGNLGSFKSFSDMIRIAQEGLKNQANSTASATDANERFSVAWRNLEESAGKIIAPLQEIGGVVLKGLSAMIEQAIIPSVDALVDKFGGMDKIVQQVFDTFGDIVVEGMSIASTAISNFQEILSVAGTSIALSLERIRQGFEYTFAKAIPSYVQLAGEIFDENGSDNWDQFGKVLLSGRIGEAFKALHNDFPKMEESDYAKSLQALLDKQMNELAAEFSNNVEKNREIFQEIVQGIMQPAQVDPVIELAQRAGIGADGSNANGNQVLNSVQSDVLRFSPDSLAPDKQAELLMEANTNLREIKEEIQEQRRLREHQQRWRWDQRWIMVD